MQESGVTSVEHSDSQVNGSTDVSVEGTTDTFTEEQATLVDGITRNLKRRRLTRPQNDNAYSKILRLKEIHPQHDYSINGTKYIARIMVRMGRQSVKRGDLELASMRLLSALKYDPNVPRQSQLRSAIATAVRERDTKQKTEESSLTAYLPNDLPADLAANKAASDDSNQADGQLQKPSQVETDNATEDAQLIVPVMVAIPAGNFLMGSDDGAADEQPVHHVQVAAFSMSKHEVTLEQYQVFATETGRPAPQYAPEKSNLPVTNVSWFDSIAYAEWLSGKTGRSFRLPSESEWEYAARAGTTSVYNTGDTVVGVANCGVCGGEWSGKSAAPVGSFEPNEFGLYDTHGNVWEWVEDCWTDDYQGRGKSAAPVEVRNCERRVLRGGSWYNDASFARSSYRGHESGMFRDGGVGFRVVHEGL